MHSKVHPNKEALEQMQRAGRGWEKKELLKKVFELKNTVLEILDWTDIADGRWVSKYENRSIKIKDKETDLQ